MILLLILYAVLFGILLRTYAVPDHRHIYPWMKLCTGLCFTGIAVYSAVQSSRPDLLVFLLPAMLLSVTGDVFLGFVRIRGNFSGKGMFAGMILFAAAHVFFYLTFSRIYPPVPADFILPLPVCLAVFLLIRRPEADVKKMGVPCVLYAYFVGLLMAKGLSALILFGMRPSTLILFFGSALFLLSDIILLFMNFFRESKPYLIYFNLFSYYAATALLGITFIFL